MSFDSTVTGALLVCATGLLCVGIGQDSTFVMVAGLLALVAVAFTAATCPDAPRGPESDEDDEDWFL